MSFFTPAAEKMFAEREAALVPLAQRDPYRHPPERRTWWDWKEIDRRTNEQHDDRDALDTLWRAMQLAPTLDVAKALLRGEKVPLDRLDPEYVRRYGLR